MEVNAFVNRYRLARENFYRWRYNTNTVYKFMLAFTFTCLTGVSAFLRVYTPFSPVPITAQVFVVLVSGVVLGSTYGGLSQAMYMALGIIGMPWFAGGNSGLEYVMGVTGGYIVGFMFAAALIGYLADNYTQSRTIWGMVPTMLVGVGVIYAFGAAWLGISLGLGLWDTIVMGMGVFIVFDIVKALIASGVGRAITTRTQYLS